MCRIVVNPGDLQGTRINPSAWGLWWPTACMQMGLELGGGATMSPTTDAITS